MSEDDKYRHQLKTLAKSSNDGLAQRCCILSKGIFNWNVGAQAMKELRVTPSALFLVGYPLDRGQFA